MKKENIVIATIRPWNVENAERFCAENRNRHKVYIVTNKRGLSYEKMRRLNPRYIFFPHWSWAIPRDIYKSFECVVFHMTDLPFGRGGSPLQNLIERGIYKTKISAIKVTGRVDAGPIYIKRSLGLEGSASDIYRRASGIIFKNMIPRIIKNNPKPVSQKGRVVKFARRTPDKSNMAHLNSGKKIYDHIRMLDAEGYPRAFIETPKVRIEFFNARLENNHVISNARIIKK